MSLARKMGPRLAAAALVAPLLSGCFTYAAVPVEQVTPGSHVLVRIAPAHAAELQRALGYPASELRGEALASAGDTLMLQVAGAGASDPAASAIRQNVSLAPGEVEEVQLQRVNWTKTGLVAGAAAVVGGVVVASLFHADQRSNQNNPKTGPNAARAPWIGFSIHP